MKKRYFFSLLAIASMFGIALLYSCAGQKMSSYQEESIVFRSENIFPEGIAYDSKTDAIYVSSMKYGKIGTVSNMGEYTEFLDDPDLISSSGITIDPKRRRLYVASVDVGASIKTASSTQKKLAGLAVYDIDTKQRLAFLRLDELYKGDHFANEIVLAQDGTAYVSDSFSPVIYQVSADLRSTSLFIEDKRFLLGDGFNLNGMVVYGKHSGSTLLVLKYNTGELFSINIETKAITAIALPHGINIHGADGLILYKNYYLVVPHNDGNDGITLLALSKDMTEVKEAKTVFADAFAMNDVVEVTLGDTIFTFHAQNGLDFPTTVTTGGDKIFVLNASLSTMFAGNPQNLFSIATVVAR